MLEVRYSVRITVNDSIRCREWIWLWLEFRLGFSVRVRVRFRIWITLRGV